MGQDYRISPIFREPIIKNLTGKYNEIYTYMFSDLDRVDLKMEWQTLTFDFNFYDNTF